MSRIGEGYLGSPDIMVSAANQEVVPTAPVSWTLPYQLYKFSFYNTEVCHVSINGGDWIYLKAGQGFNSELNDANITSFKIQEAGIHYNFIAAF
jgi:hypothetical protein